ncbi:MAG TPA: glycosyltransferase family 2 protein [Tepidisphaeraceae bacterium]|nr:glycosyltransferase family 2 protein [Tepidisphaeraceae bacterium]
MSSPQSNTCPPAAGAAPRCLVIVPAFNESKSVGRVVRRLRRALPGHDVLVIDDGSTDDTACHVPPDCTVVSLPFNLGIGGAMQTGYRYAALHNYDVAVQVDGDGQHRPGEVRRLVERLVAGDDDLVVGSRFLENARYRQSISRMAGSVVLGGMIRLLGGLRVTDCTSGFRAASKRTIRAFAHWYPEDYPEPEVILLLHRAGFRIGELPVRMRQRRHGVSSISLLGGVFYVLKVVVCLCLDLARNPWPLTPAAAPVTPTPADPEPPSPLPQKVNGHDRPAPAPAAAGPGGPADALRRRPELRVPGPQPVPGAPGRDAPGPGHPPAPSVPA